MLSSSLFSQVRTLGFQGKVSSFFDFAFSFFFSRVLKNLMAATFQDSLGKSQHMLSIDFMLLWIASPHDVGELFSCGKNDSCEAF